MKTRFYRTTLRWLRKLVMPLALGCCAHLDLRGSDFPGSLVLGRPTDSSITANLLSATPLTVYLEYGTASGSYPSQSACLTLAANVPQEVTVTGLNANTRHYYRVRFQAAAATSFDAGPECSFVTQRAPGSTFTFCVQGDSHPERLKTQFDPAFYALTLQTAAADHPDFYLTIGDDFSIDQIDPATISAAQVTERYTIQRPYLGLIGQSAAVFLVNGNHEQAARYLLDGTPNNPAVWAQNARNTYYSQPGPDGFYSGNTEQVQHIGLLRNYFAWTWGDALFVTIDPYWESPVCVDNPFFGGAKRSNLWDITHGDAQYQWLKTTLEQSKAKYKFVFAHHVMGTGRGGIEQATRYEWGGRNTDGSWGFTTSRPNWVATIHQLMVDNHVTIFFQGHDHIWVHQQLDGVTYQTLSVPADPNYSLLNADAFTSGEKFPNTGYTRVTVTPTGVKVDYVRTYLPADEGPGKSHGSVAFSYSIGAPSDGVPSSAPPPFDVVLGRPADHAVAVSVLATVNLEAVVDYGTAPATYPQQSAVTALTAGTPTVVTIDGLPADTTHYYRIRYRSPGGADYSAGPEGSFTTQRAAGKTFTFAIEADPHYMDNEPAVWQLALANILADKPDFLIDLGDTFMDEKFGSSSYAQTLQTHAAVRSGFFSQIGGSVPLLLVNGNHDPELGWLLSRSSPQDNAATWGVKARQACFPCPIPGSFYSGDLTTDPFTGAARDGYYAFEWGNALFITLDPFWYTSPQAQKSGDPWLWTLGRAQYDWLKRTLEQSHATFKMIFLHHLVGGSSDLAARGGVEGAPYYEWGGGNLDGSSGFAAKRPGWPMPIQELLLANKVNIVFHGHDHLYVKQDLDTNGDGLPDLIYQEVPQPSRSNQSTASAAGYGYTTGTLFPSSGHLRVTVAPTQLTVEYVRAVISTDARAGVPNRYVSHRYTVNAANSAPAFTQPLTNQVAAPGGTAAFTVAASGSPPLSYQWQKDGASLPGATGATLALSPVQPSDAGTYRVVVTNALGTATSATATLSVGSSRLSNVSVRASAGTGNDTLIVGLGISGGNALPLLLRGVGPTLQNFGVTGFLPDPVLTLFAGSSVLATNDDWTTAGNAAQIASAAVQTGAFALSSGSRDSALLWLLPPGTYTAQISGKAAATGIALLEAYDASSSADARLTNLSARTLVGSDGATLIAGFAIAGNVPKQLLIRGIGPTLAGYGVSNTLPDPKLALYRLGASAPLQQNDNWGSAANAGQLPLAAARAGAFVLPAGSRDAALLLTLDPGVYSAQLSDAAGAAGVALVEIYDVP